MKPLCFVLDSAAQDRTPKAILKGDWQCCRAGDTRLFQRRYLDSLDWRLLRNDLYLIADQAASGWHLRLFSLRDHRQLAAAHLVQPPVFVPAAGLDSMNAVLLAILGRRALVSQTQLAVTQHPLAVVDDRGAVVAHLDLEFNEPRETLEAGATFNRRLWFVPVAGQDKQHKTLVNTLSRHGLPVSGAVIPITEVIAALHIDTTCFDARPRLIFKPDQPCNQAVRRLLAFFLEIMEANRPAVAHDVDTECLHDFRVAVRRSRSLLGQLRTQIAPRQAESAGRVFGKLSRATNRQRDLDVMLLNFDIYRSLLPAQHRARLDPVYAAVVDQRQAALAATVRLLNSPEYRRFVRAWRGYLGGTAPRRISGRGAHPVKDAADASIWKLYKRILAEGGAINAESPPEVLHALRKRCKTLRYLIEFFVSLYPEEKLKKALKVMKRLQDNLGEYQDLYVHGALLAETRRRLLEHDLLRPETDVALSAVTGALDRRAAACRQRFTKRFSVFANDAHQQLFRRLFKP